MTYKKSLKEIENYYGDETTNRGSIPLINHIYEGLTVMDFFVRTDTMLDSNQFKNNDDSRTLFCLHPIFQNDEDYHKNYKIMEKYSGDIEILINHYRITANGHLLGYSDNIILSRYPEVNMALISDKISNRYNFEKNHEKTHAKSKELRKYFSDWFIALGIKNESYNTIKHFLDEMHKK